MAMFLTTGALVLSRKISDRRAKSKQEKLQLLKHESGSRPQINTIPEINEPFDRNSGYVVEPGRNISNSGQQPQSHIQSPNNGIQPDHDTNSTLSPSATNSEQIPQGDPPPYSPLGTLSSCATSIAETNTLSPDTTVPRTTASSNTNTLSPDSSVPRTSGSFSETSTISSGASITDTSLRIRTKGNDLKSGFPYATELFNLRVHPELWDRFTAQIVESTKFNTSDYGKMVGAATATALTGALLTSVYVGRSVNHSLQEKKVKAGLENMSDGGLGDLLKQFNEHEFKALGLFVHLELSACAMKRANHRSPTMSKHPLLYSKREDRERKTEERKFCLVVTRLDEEGVPADAIEEIVHEAGEQEEGMKVVEAPNAENVIYEVPELPGDEVRFPVELPAGVSLGYGSDKFTIAIPELDSTPVTAKGTGTGGYGLDLKDKGLDDVDEEGDEDAGLRPQPLMVTAETHAALNKEFT